MSRRIFMDAFFNQFSDFLDQLIKVFPNDMDFPAYKTGLVLLQKTNPMIVVQEVVKHVTPFEKLVRAKDENFLLNYQFSEYDTLEQIINKLKNMWSSLSDNNKQVVWNYIILLLDLSQKCLASQ